jgi:hypothetical protein
MAEDESQAKVLEIVWGESRSQVAEQESSLEALRNRSIALLSVGSIVAGLFGAELIHVSALHWRLWPVLVALIAFAGSVAAAITVLFPKKEMEFYQDVTPYLDDIKAGEEVTVEDVTYNLARHTEASWDRNETKLKALHSKFKLICCLLAVQVIAWAVAVL